MSSAIQFFINHPTIRFFINRKLGYLEKPLEEAREKVRLLEEDERTLAWMHRVEDGRLRRVERLAADLEPLGRVRRMLLRLIGVKSPDIAGILLGPVADEREELRRRLADARRKFGRLKEEHGELNYRKKEITRARRQHEELLHGEETVRHFEAPGRVRTALARMVDDVFATMKRQLEACATDDFAELSRLMEVEKAQRARLHGLWRIDPVRHGQGTWSAVTKENSVPYKYAALRTFSAERSTRERLKEARVRGCPAEIQRLEDEERLLDERILEVTGFTRSRRYRRRRHLAPPRDAAALQQCVPA